MDTKLNDKIESLDTKLNGKIETLNENVNGIKLAILSIQGREFRSFCRRLLEENHIITTEEYEQCIQDHDAYNGIGGNHRGDLLFDAVEVKYKN